ncbi:Semaphorin-4F [Myotis brandtii]|uniref:Semaphorin-4F n=1 Tax=Myotis brandtii TaxID=109478 RepID=S7QEI5_MYOBR|nr:Semaphorin-4F [Myotis brandtii]
MPMLLSPQGDHGGRRMLQKRWTTFLRTDLRCPGSVDGRASSVLQDMAILRPENGVEAPLFYGLSSSQWEEASISAVCAFRPQDIRTVLNGPFRELKDVCNRGQPVMESEVPQPRPGEVRGVWQLFTPCQNRLIRARAQVSIVDTSGPLGNIVTYPVFSLVHR